MGADGSSAAEPPRALYYSSEGVFSARRPATGGLLALEMGMGKTVVALALVLASPAPHGAPRGTLVVVPTTLLGGWKTETAKLLPKRLKARYQHVRLAACRAPTPFNRGRCSCSTAPPRSDWRTSRASSSSLTW